MAQEIKQLQPQVIWNYFYEITQFPRPTGQTKEVAEYIASVGKKLGLETKRDEVGNVLIIKPATPGMENRPKVTLQGHMDMVPQKNKEVTHDFTKDPIDARIDGEWVRANGTTLGADNGMGCAMALAVLSDNTLKHGPIEALFTVDEEVGMIGANELKAGFATGDILMNMDSEEEGNLFIGCAGGIDVNVLLEYKEQENESTDDIAVKVTLAGLKGGHSGVEIHLGRANSNKLMARFLKKAICEYGVRLASFEGGSMRNAIPRDAEAVVTLAPEDAEGFNKMVAEWEQIFRKEYEGIEDAITLKVEKCPLPKMLIPEEIQDNFINALEACVNGPVSMLQSFKNTVESSTNMSIVTAKEGKIIVRFLVRSSSQSRKMQVASQVESAFLLMGADVEFDVDYSGWQPNTKSHALEVLKKAYTKVYGKEPEVKVMHAGLECGIIQGVMPDMDMISFGPTIEHPHSPDERVNIASVERTYKVVEEALANI